jgi:hypothetical protein
LRFTQGCSASRDLSSVLQFGFVVGIVSLIFGIWRFRHGRQANLRVEELKVYENAAAPFGVQAQVSVRNTGGAAANNVVLWIADPFGVRLDHDYTGEPELVPGASDRLRADLPGHPSVRPLYAWVGWEDRRSRRKRNAGRLPAPAK